MAHSFSSEQVWFKPLNRLQKNINETLLTVCVPPTGYMVLTGGEITYTCFLSHLIQSLRRHCRRNQSLGHSVWQAANTNFCWICDFEADMDTAKQSPGRIGCRIRGWVCPALLVLVSFLSFNVWKFCTWSAAVQFCKFPRLRNGLTYF
jgi:hypothetical protein